MYKTEGRQVLYFDSTPLFELATVIILSSWQFSLHDGGERNHRLNDCNCLLSIHFSFLNVNGLRAHVCTVIH